jgi:hypothetical protein
MAGGGAMDLICMCPSHISDSLSLLWKEGGGNNETDVMSSKVIGLSQVLERFNIRIWVNGERAKVLLYLREVSKEKGDMDPHNVFRSSHFPGRVDGNWLTGWSVRESVCGGSWVLWFWVGRRMGGRAGRKRSRGEGGRRGRGKWWGLRQKEGWG